MTRTERSVTGCRWFLAAAMLLALVAVQPPAAAQPTVFTDIAGDVFEADIEWMIDQGALTAADSLPTPGTGAFLPHDDIKPSHLSVWLGRLDDSTTDLSAGRGRIPSGLWLTRIQAAYVMAEYFGLLPHTDTDHPFSDMGSNSVADNRVVDALYDAGITIGFVSGTFGPGESLTRGQAAAMLHRGFSSAPVIPIEDCGAPWSGTQVVGGVCVEACSGANLIPQFDADGANNGCIDLGACPYDQYGFDPTQYRPTRNFGPLWQDGSPVTAAVAPGVPHTFTRTVARCSGIWREVRWLVDDHCADGRSESNIDPRGDCVQFSMSIEAAVPANTSGWRFVSLGCHNRSLPVEATWVTDDAVCSYADGQWTRSYGNSNPQPTGIDIGEWTVALDVDNFVQREAPTSLPSLIHRLWSL